MSGDRSKLTQFLVKGLIAFVIIVGGVVTGMFIGNRVGVAKQLEAHETPPASMLSVIKQGELFPDIAVLSPDGSTTRFLDAIENDSNRSSIIVFASSGCMPCHDFLVDLTSSPKYRSGKLHVILLADHTLSFAEFSGLRIFEVPATTLDQLEVHAFPTYCEVAGDGTIRGAWTLYNPNNPPPFM